MYYGHSWYCARQQKGTEIDVVQRKQMRIWWDKAIVTQHK